MKKKTLAIIQSNYIPWKGYFDIIKSADTFILLDDVQYTKNDWRNRNRIKTANGLKWLTIPVQSKGRFHQSVNEAKVSSSDWSKLHISTIRHFYRRAEHFDKCWDWLAELYKRAAELENLSEINRLFILAVTEFLGINTDILRSTDFDLCTGKTERLVYLCRQANAGRYLTGPGTRGYLRTNLFEEAGVEVKFVSYPSYPEYKQLYPPFEHNVSIIDTILNCGLDTRDMIQGLAIN